MICVYFLDFWSPASAKSVLECLLVDHGALPSSCKSDLYTYLDITSGVSCRYARSESLDFDLTPSFSPLQHPSGLRSTEYQPKELIDPDEIEEYLAAYRESKQTVKVRSAVRDDDDDFEDEQPARKSKSASPGKARSVSPAKSKPAAPAKAKAPLPAKSPKKQVPAAEDDDGSVTEDDEEEAEVSSASIHAPLSLEGRADLFIVALSATQGRRSQKGSQGRRCSSSVLELFRRQAQRTQLLHYRCTCSQAQARCSKARAVLSTTHKALQSDVTFRSTNTHRASETLLHLHACTNSQCPSLTHTTTNAFCSLLTQ